MATRAVRREWFVELSRDKSIVSFCWLCRRVVRSVRL